jgi:hypothetical protein
VALFDIVNRGMKGQLKRKLRRMKADGLSYDRMADELEKAGYPVSRETCRRWIAGLDEAKATAAVG